MYFHGTFWFAHARKNWEFTNGNVIVGNSRQCLLGLMGHFCFINCSFLMCWDVCCWLLVQIWSVFAQSILGFVHSSVRNMCSLHFSSMLPLCHSSDSSTSFRSKFCYHNVVTCHLLLPVRANTHEEDCLQPWYTQLGQLRRNVLLLEPMFPIRKDVFRCNTSNQCIIRCVFNEMD